MPEISRDRRDRSFDRLTRDEQIAILLHKLNNLDGPDVEQRRQNILAGIERLSGQIAGEPGPSSPSDQP